MLTKQDLLGYKGSLGFNLGQTEVDYLQHVFLYSLYRKIKDELVFKGGTCLQKTFGLNRFSEDLDFTMKNEVNIGAMTKSANVFGYEMEVGKEKNDGRGASLQLRIKGPLYDGTEKSTAHVRIEVSKRGRILLEPEVKLVTPVYHDLPPYTLAAMKTEEILAEKVRAAMTRGKARDVYDLWFLLKKGVKVDLGLVNEKLGYYNMAFDRRAFIGGLKGKSRIWAAELGPIVASFPNFRDAISEIQTHFG